MKYSKFFAFTFLLACSTDDGLVPDNQQEREIISGTWSLIRTNTFTPNDDFYQYGDVLWEFDQGNGLTVTSSIDLSEAHEGLMIREAGTYPFQTISNDLVSILNQTYQWDQKDEETLFIYSLLEGGVQLRFERVDQLPVVKSPLPGVWSVNHVIAGFQGIDYDRGEIVWEFRSDGNLVASVGIDATDIHRVIPTKQDGVYQYEIGGTLVVEGDVWNYLLEEESLVLDGGIAVDGPGIYFERLD